METRGVVDIDGELHAASEAKISVFDRGFLYGDSAFETLRTYGARPFREREHYERLARSCALLRMELPLALDALAARTARAIAASKLPECYVRVVVTRGEGPLGLDLSLAGKPTVVVYALALKLPAPELYARGIAVGLVRLQRATDGNPAEGAKASNYLASALALDDVKRRGGEEALVLGARGEVLEGTTSNVFIVREGRLSTPPLTGILEGITRRTVLELARAAALPCTEHAIGTEDLLAADEVFITSSIREIMPVVRVDDARIGSGEPGPITLSLLAAYRARAGAGA